MKKTAFFLCCVLLLPALCAVPVFAASSGGGFQPSAPVPGGGFSGPGIAPVSVEQAKSMRDDAPVTLRGNIIQHLGKDNYLFKDASGSIHVEIDHDKWGGQTITPADAVELHGKVDKDWNSVEVEVSRVVKLP